MDAFAKSVMSRLARLALYGLIGMTSTTLMPQSIVQARPTTCWFQQVTDAPKAPASYCDVTKTGEHRSGLFRLTTDGVTRIIYLERGGYAMVSLSGKLYTARWKYDKEGDVMLTFSDGSWFAFKMP